MSEITKAKVLEVFMRIFNALPGDSERRRVGVAYNSTLDEFAPSTLTASPDREKVLDTVCMYLDEVLKDDFGIEVRVGEKITVKGAAAALEGGKAAKTCWAEHRDRVPPPPVDTDGVEDDEAYHRWLKTVNALAFEYVPTAQAGDQEWVRWFISGFTGDMWRFVQGLEGLDYRAPEETPP